RLGGQAADADRLWSIMERYDADRAAIRAAAGRALPEARGTVPVAVVGGPVMRGHERVFEAVEEAGGRVVLDATETGLRSLPAPFDRRRGPGDDPLLALVDAYFGGIADVFQRPDTRLMDALVHETRASGARGIILWRYVWCDLWAALAERLREAAGLPVLALDVAGDAASLRQAVGRVQAFMEILR
ncbi:MAG: 2-hydroxyacyl-CoA dehydratase, partial [Planctomycetes bacterium]|nr:2-hydroxyacyl-CoA dehydratase [Planctomycetota bacterium]